MNERIYITHCCAKKNDELKLTSKKSTPDILYTATPTQRFMHTCKNNGVSWGIFSDKYGMWKYPEQHEWYEKNPDSITEQEFHELLEQFDGSLSTYNEIYFYNNPGRFHKLYKRLISESKLRDRITLFTHIYQIR